MKEMTFRVFPGLFEGDLRLPNLELEARSREISLARFRDLILHDASQELDPQARIRTLAASGAISMARSILKGVTEKQPARLTESNIQELEAFIDAEQTDWSLVVIESINKVILSLKKNKDRLGVDTLKTVFKIIELAKVEHEKGFYDSAWDKAESAKEIVRMELERLKREQDQHRQEAYMLIDSAERIFLEKRSALPSPASEYTVVEILSRARAFCLEEDIDLERIQKMTQVAHGLIDGVEYPCEEIQGLIGKPAQTLPQTEASPLGEAPEAQTEPKLTSDQVQKTESELLLPRSTVVPAMRTQDVRESIQGLLDALSPEQLRRLVADALNPLGLVASGPMISNEPRLKDKFAEARHLYQRGEFEKAHRIFLEVHNSMPLYARRQTSPVSPALFNAAASALAADQYQEVIKLLESCRNALFGFPLWNLGVAYYGAERVKDTLSVVLQWTQRAKASWVPAYYGYYTASLLLWMLGNHEEAVTLMQEAWKEDPGYIRSHLQTVLKERFPSKLPAGVRVDKETFDRTSTILEGLLTPRPPDRYIQFSMAGPTAQAAIGRAIERVGEGDTEGALQQLLEIESQGATIAPLSWAIGACQLLLGHAGDAMERLSQGSAHIRLPGAVWWNLTVAHFQEGDIEGARLSIQQCIGKEFSTSPTAWLVSGLLAYVCGDEEDAQGAVRRSARFSEAARTQAALALDRIRDRRLLEALPESFARRISEPVIKKAEPQEPPEMFERFKEAIQQATKIRLGDYNRRSAIFADLAPAVLGDILEVQLTPFEIAFLDNIPPSTPPGVLTSTFVDAVRAYRDGRFIESADLFSRYVEGVDDSYIGLINRGCALFRAGRLNDAVATFEQAAEIRGVPHGGYAWWNLAVALRERGDFEDALDALRQERQCDSQHGFVLHNLNLALLAGEVGDQETTATALYDTCRFSKSPSVSLRCHAIKACRDVSDWERVIALLGNFIDNKDLPEVIAGVTRPRETPEECRTLADMEANLRRFSFRKDRRAAVDFFSRVENLRLQAAAEETVSAAKKENAIYALIFHGFALIRYEQPFEAAECYARALELLDRYHEEIGSHSYAEICLHLAKEEVKFHPMTLP